MFVVSNGYVYFSQYCDDDRARVSTGIKIPKGTKGLDRSLLKKSEQLMLSRVEDAVTKYVESTYRLQEKTKKVKMEQVVLTALGKEKRLKSGVINDYRQMMLDMKSGDLLKPRENTRYSEKTIKNYESTLKYLLDFTKETKNQLTYNINEEWVNLFIIWLTKPKIVEKRLNTGATKQFSSPGYSKNSISVIVGYLKGFLSNMYRQGKHNSLFFRHEVFQLKREDADTEALNEAEIKSLYDLQLEPAQERARDVFVFACWVGLRSEDLQRINDYKFKDGLFELHTEKTGARVIIPAHPMSKAIYEKYGGNMPVFEYNNLLNFHIAKLCRLAGFTEECLVVMTIGGKKIVRYYPKWQMISIHSARRSFATNAYLAGIKTFEIMKITGHASEESFMRYIRIKLKENAARLAEHPFFKGS